MEEEGKPIRFQSNARLRPDIFVGEWISVEEDMPEEGERVLIYIESKNFPEASTVLMAMRTPHWKIFYSTGIDGVFEGRNVTHWMQMPFPPRKEEGETIVP